MFQKLRKKDQLLEDKGEDTELVNTDTLGELDKSMTRGMQEKTLPK